MVAVAAVYVGVIATEAAAIGVQHMPYFAVSRVAPPLRRTAAERSARRCMWARSAA